MSKIIKVDGYKQLLNPTQTEQGIKQIKEFFQLNLATALRLRRVTAPLFVLRGLGLNDDLNGVERPVSFPIKDMGDQVAEVVHSLAKWKRYALNRYHFSVGEGLYTEVGAGNGNDLIRARHIFQKIGAQLQGQLSGEIGGVAFHQVHEAHGAFRAEQRDPKSQFHHVAFTSSQGRACVCCVITGEAVQDFVQGSHRRAGSFPFERCPGLFRDSEGPVPSEQPLAVPQCRHCRQ